MSKKRHAKHPDLHCSIGARVVSQKYGHGVVTDINLSDPEFRYNVSFDDGTKVWYDGRGTIVLEGEAS